MLPAGQQLINALVDVERHNAEKRAQAAGDWATHAVKLTEEHLEKIVAQRGPRAERRRRGWTLAPRSDWDGNGEIDKSEVLMALTTWGNLAKTEAKKRSSACLVA